MLGLPFHFPRCTATMKRVFSTLLYTQSHRTRVQGQIAANVLFVWSTQLNFPAESRTTTGKADVTKITTS